MQWPYGIGLDIGVASIGWAVVALNDLAQPCGFIRLGSRVFPGAEHPKTGESLAAPRRMARSMRRRTRRKALRKQDLYRLMEQSGLAGWQELSALFEAGHLEDIYALRTRALDEPITPQEFARSVCAPGEYVALTSFTHHPFYADFALEVADNSGREPFFNVPIDTLMTRLERAVRAGRGVCWEGDVTEPGFSFGRGVARLPEGEATGQADRQAAFERFLTTDDHCMAVVGLARDARGELFYIMKNSWGTGNPYGGMVYMAESYLRLKTVAVVMPADVAR